MGVFVGACLRWCQAAKDSRGHRNRPRCRLRWRILHSMPSPCRYPESGLTATKPTTCSFVWKALKQRRRFSYSLFLPRPYTWSVAQPVSGFDCYRTDYQVTFPMSWNGAIFDTYRALTDRHAISDMTSSLWRMRLRVPEFSLGTQTLG